MITQNNPDSIKGGSAASTFDQATKYERSAVNTPDSIMGGSAATNYPATPTGVTPPGGIKTSELDRGSSYEMPTQFTPGGTTNDHAK